MASGLQDQQLDVVVAPQKKEVTTIVQRKWKRTEQSRKLAEARREFLEKFGNSKPDRQKLTMVDLVFYNPTTNPMRYIGILLLKNSQLTINAFIAAAKIRKIIH